MGIEYRPLSEAELSALWDRHVAENVGEGAWIGWRERFLTENRTGRAVSFGVLIDRETVGEGTLLLSPDAAAIRGRTALCDGVRVGNINALRIRPAYEGKGHISALLRTVEDYARARGLALLTIGVESGEVRTRAIYHHLGYTLPILTEVEGGCEVVYLGKPLAGEG